MPSARLVRIEPSIPDIRWKREFSHFSEGHRGRRFAVARWAGGSRRGDGNSHASRGDEGRRDHGRRGHGGALTRCGDDSEPSGAKDGASSNASRSDGGQEQSTAAVRTAHDKTAEAESARMTIRMRLATEGETVTPHGNGAPETGPHRSAS
jgi:hypothetical protein